MQPVSAETHWEAAAKTRMGKYLTKLEASFIQKSLRDVQGGIIVDVGAEAGRFAMLTANGNTTVVGLDIDGYSLHRLKQKNRDVTVIQTDARHIPLRNGAFDAVLMIEVLDYIPQVDEALSECHRILKPSAPFVFSFGNQASLKAKFRGFRGKTYIHTYDKVVECLKTLGFRVSGKLGYSWLPFGRMSQSSLIPIFAGIEGTFGLRRVLRFSPWVLLKAEKSS
jgi:ubiquinone/menaquinone biosynthesis C-methylase UbiE